MNFRNPFRNWTLHHLELFLLAITLLATVVISALTLRQTTRHLEVERTSAFVSRFNSQELVSIREDVDRWIESGEKPKLLYERSDFKSYPKDKQTPENRAESERALKTVANLRTLTNYFQEFGTAIKIGSLDEYYAHELLGGICIRYGKELLPFIEETRIIRKRPNAYAEVLLLKARMEQLEPH